MAFPNGTRVVLLQDHAGIAAGSLGTVANGGPATSMVNFDVDPDRDVFVPNRLLRERRADMNEPVQIQKEKDCPDPSDTLRWSTPTVVAPGVGTKNNFAPVTATPNTLSLLFQRAEVVLRQDLRLGEVTSGCWTGSLEFPVEGGPATVQIDVRAAVEQPDGAWSAIMIVVGRETHTVTFKGQVSDQNVFHQFKSEIGPEPLQTITAILLAQRPEPPAEKQTELHLTLDSVDIVKITSAAQSPAQLPPPAAPQTPPPTVPEEK